MQEERAHREQTIRRERERERERVCVRVRERVSEFKVFFRHSSAHFED